MSHKFKPMKSNLFVCLLGIALVSGDAFAQSPEKLADAMPTKVVGGIQDGKARPPSPPKKLPDFTIRWSQVHRKKGQKFVINRIQVPPKLVEQPVTPLKQQQIEQRAREIEQWIEDIKESGGFFTVSATIYDNKTSYVRWSVDGKWYACYSNVNWQQLSGFTEFEGRGKRFNIILLTANASTKDMKREMAQGYRNSLPDIPKLPRLATHGARYTVVEGDETNDAAMEFMEAIHDLYDEHREVLVEKWREREKNYKIYLRKQEALRRNPPPKKDVVVNYWRKKNPPRSQEERAAGKGVKK